MPNNNNWLSFTLSEKDKNNINEINEEINNIMAIDIIDYNLIHMTCVFLGKLLQGKKKTLLIKINNIIKNYIKKLKDMNIILIFDKYDYLPFDKPNKKLLVAIYKENKKLKLWNYELRIELNKLGVCNYITNDFMSHITIGKIKKIYEINGIKKISKYPNININDLYLDGVKNKYILN